jgi:hypothetical protein
MVPIAVPVRRQAAAVEVHGVNWLKHLFYHFTPAIVFHESIHSDLEVKHFNFLPFGTAGLILNQK